MNATKVSSKNATAQRVYQRRNRKQNRTHTISLAYLPITTTILPTANTTLLLNSSAVFTNDFTILSLFTQNKFLFLIALLLLILLCIISIIFLVIILKCKRKKNWKIRRQQRKDIKLAQDIPDFLDDHPGNKGESVVLITSNDQITMFDDIKNTNGTKLHDNISNTLSLDPMLQEKIIKNNLPNTPGLPLPSDDTSIDTLRGSLISSPSQQTASIQTIPTPTHSITVPDSITNLDDKAVEFEKDDGLNDLDLKGIKPRFIKGINNSGSNISSYRTSVSSVEQSIRKQERRNEEEEHRFLHGSNSNLYEKELRKQAEKESFSSKPNTNSREQTPSKPHTLSQASLVSRTSEDSCY
ncbi:unnamed protein product [Adineta steineri]|uniref:Uncharacterized protein n=1 Tax=Adineta steineri TaxID=433720 RepID=A0A814JIC8_9BILA|nr:unnamed protein product [Adineta steineri]CAF1037875.1 unnamed protein product [Adineta steineri]